MTRPTTEECLLALRERGWFTHDIDAADEIRRRVELHYRLVAALEHMLVDEDWSADDVIALLAEIGEDDATGTLSER